MRINYYKVNDLIIKAIIENKPSSILRLDNTARFIIQYKLVDEIPPLEYFNEYTLIQGGIYPHDPKYYWEVIIPKSLDIMKKADIIGFTDVTDNFNTCIAQENVLIKEFIDTPVFGGNSILVMDPGGLLGHAKNFFGIPKVDDPWTKYLRNKKVLVISTHAETIRYQYNKLDKIWGSNKDIIAPFELVGVIRSPYHPMMDDRQYPNCNHWGDTVNYIMKEIEKYDFDILLTGASTSSVFYAHHAKDIGKIGIQTGGVIQLFFGILGYRWTQVPGYSEWHNMYNENWIYPLQIDEAQNRKKYMQLETNFAYW